MTFRAGDLVLLPFPFTDLSSQKRRPALVLRDSDLRGDFVALAITSQRQDLAAALIEPTDLAEGVLPKTSWVRLDKPYSFNSKLVVARFGSLKPQHFESVRAQVCVELGCR